MNKFYVLLKSVIFITLFVSASVNAYSQGSTANYIFSTTATASMTQDMNGNTIDMTTGTTQRVGARQDQFSPFDTPAIGFVFPLMGLTYTQFSPSSNGILQLGPTFAKEDNYVASKGTPASPQLAAFAGDLQTGPQGKVHSKVFGTAPNRVLVVEYLNMNLYYRANTYTNDATYQVRLYESGVIEFVYGAVYVRRIDGSPDDRSPSIGFSTGTADNKFISVKTSDHSVIRTGTFFENPNSVVGTHPDLDSTLSGSRMYRFTPPMGKPAKPALAFTSDFAPTSMKLNWTDSSTNESFFVVARSLDSLGTYTNVGFVNSSDIGGMGAALSYTDVGLFPLTKYYYKIFASNEAAVNSDSISTQGTTTSGTFSGIKTIGPGHDYATITAALAAANTQALSGPAVLSLQSNYISTSETFPITIGAIGGTSATNTLTIRPAVSGLVITSNSTTATFDLNGAQYIRIDGRVNGTGPAKGLTIENTTTNGVAIRFINEAHHDSIRYCNIEGRNTSTGGGVIQFAGTTGVNGNDNNVIDHNDIHNFDAVAPGSTTGTAGFPAIGIYSGGASFYIRNNDNIISNNNIFNYYNASLMSVGVYIGQYSHQWTIDSNRFYQTAARSSYTGGNQHSAIRISDGNTHTITRNIIGYSSSAETGLYEMSGSLRFSAIDIFSSGPAGSSIQGNKIKALKISSSFASALEPGTFCGIYSSGNTVSIGTQTGNIIGDSTGTGSILVTNTSTNTITTSYGIALGGSIVTSTLVKNNIIGSIDLTSNSNTVGHSFNGILNGSSSPTTVVISGNKIGSTTTANSIQCLRATTGSTANAAQVLYGLYSINTGSATISNNTFSNLTNATLNTATAAQTKGISYTSGVGTITGNTICNITTSAGQQGSGTFVSLGGIQVSSSSAGSVVSGNTIYSLHNLAATANVNIHGIYYMNGTKATISRNTIYNLYTPSTGTPVVIGIYLGTNTAGRISNNVVRLGYYNNGGVATSITGKAQLIGIDKVAGTMAAYFNSIYIGGTDVGTTGPNSFALRRQNTGTDTVMNNILMNNRSNTTTGGKHYIFSLNNTTTLLEDNNLFYGAGTGFVFGVTGSTDRVTHADWKSATSQSISSMFADPNFTNATSLTPDLHLNNPTPAERGAVAIAGITTDYDNETRSSLTPNDIGADAGNFTPKDILAPVINYTLITKGTLQNRVLSNFAAITDNIGVSSNPKPKFYYKKSTDADVFAGNTSADNGWKFVEASNSSSPYSFTVDYSIINGGSVVNADTIQYFIVAQDDSNNFRSSPEGATVSGNPPLQNINGKPAAPNTYTVASSIQDTVYVGTGKTYSTLTGAGGLFFDLNTKFTTGNVTAVITSDLTETGEYPLNPLTEFGAGNYTLKIIPDSAESHLISGNVEAGLIRIAGTDRVTIDGRVGGTGKYLTFRNTDTIGSTISFSNDATNNIIRNCIVEGSTYFDSSGVIFLAPGVISGNSYITINECIVRDRSDAPGVPTCLIYSDGYPVSNTNISITDCEVFNFTRTALNFAYSGWPDANKNITITGNDIYDTQDRSTDYYMLKGISLNASGSTSTISDNRIHGIRSGNAEVYGISVEFGSVDILRNRIYDFHGTGNTSGGIYGIYFSGGYGFESVCNVINNNISIITNSSFVGQQVTGIIDRSNISCTMNVLNNTIVVGSTSTSQFFSSSSWAYKKQTYSDGASVVRNNIFYNMRAGANKNHYAAGYGSFGYQESSLILSNNLYIGTGPEAGKYMDFSRTFYEGVPTSKEAWIDSTGDQYSHFIEASEINGLGVSNIFPGINSGTLQVTDTAYAWMFNGKGAANAAVATDFNGAARSVTPGIPTDLGAYEFNLTKLPQKMKVTGTIVHGGHTTLSAYGRTIAVIDWGATGNLPDSFSVARYYSGVQAPDQTNRQRIQSYWQLEAAGTPPYNYDITYYYNPAEIGTVPEQNLRLIKSNDGGSSSWTNYKTTIDANKNTAKAKGLTNFSVATLVNKSLASLPLRLAVIHEKDTTNEDQVLNANLSSFISNIDEDTVTYTIADSTNHGTFNLNATGTFTYTPRLNYSGNDTLNYSFCNQNSLCDTGRLIITILPVNDAPLSTDDRDTTNEEVQATGNVLLNDSDIENNALTATVITTTKHGTLNLNSSGAYSYQPSANYFGYDTLIYKVCDASKCDTGMLRILVLNTADSIFITTTKDTINEDQVWNANLSAYNINIDNDTVVYTLLNNVKHGIMNLDPLGSFTYTPQLNYTGNDTLRYSACNESLLCDTGDLIITILAVNDAPSITDDRDTTNEDVATSGNVLVNDSDVEGHTLKIVLISNTSHGLLTLDSLGAYGYQPAANFFGRDTATYRVYDNGIPSLSDTGKIYFTVNPVNDKPVANNDAKTINEDESANGNVIANDSDADGDTLKVAVGSSTKHGILNLSINGVYTYQPDVNYFGKDTLIYYLFDNATPSLRDTAMLVFTIHSVNDAPSITDDRDTTNEDVSASGNVLVNDSDVEGHTLKTVLISNASHGVITLDSNGLYNYQPAANFFGRDTATYRVFDNGIPSLSDTGKIFFTVNAVNDAPLITDDRDTTNEDISASGNVLINDSDVEGHTLKAVLINNTSHGILTLDSTGTYTYQPSANFFGTDSATYRVYDNGTPSLSDTGKIIFSVNSINDKPLAVNDADTTSEDGVFNIDISINDSDVENNTLTYSVIEAPEGTLNFNNDGTLEYYPEIDFYGKDTLIYKVCDNGTPSLCDTGMVIFTITPENDAPSVNDDQDTTNEDVTLTGSVALNDTDVDGDVITYEATSAHHGIIYMDSTGHFTYTPDVNYFGADTVFYIVCDPDTLCVGAFLYITINHVNDKPVANNDAKAMNEDGIANGNVIANDSDSDGDTLKVAVGSGPKYGILNLGMDGVYTYQPNANYFGKDTLIYYLYDNGTPSLRDTAQLIFTINGINDKPVANNDAKIINEDESTNGNVITNDSDIDGDTLKVAVGSSTKHGILNLSIDGIYTYQPDVNYFGKDTLIYYLFDNATPSLRDTAMLVFTINSVNDAPSVTDDRDTTNEDVATSGNVLINDSDVEGHTLKTVLISNASHGLLTLDSLGAYNYQPAANFFGRDTATYRVYDNGIPSLSDTGKIYFTVNPVNDKPVANDDAKTTNEDVSANGNVSLNDSDIENDILSYSVITTTSHGLLNLNTDGTYSYTPVANYFGKDTLTYAVADNGTPSLKDTAMLIIMINPVNDKPIANDDGKTMNEDESANGNVSLNDSDIESGILSYSVITTTSHGLLNLNTDGTYSYTPVANYFGKDTLTYAVADNGTPSLKDTAMLIIMINPVNDKPVAADDRDTTNEDVSANGNVSFNDSDIENGILSYSVITTTSHGLLNLNTNGTYSYTPDANYFGNDTLIYYLYDNGTPSLKDTAVLIITINSVNDAPVAFDKQFSVLNNDSLIENISIIDSDPDDDSLEFTQLSEAAHGNFMMDSSGKFTYKPEEDYVGNDTLYYQVCDNALPSLCKTARLIITIGQAPLPLQLLSFNARLNDKKVLLSWSTASEIYIKDYVAERLINHKWERVGVVNAVANNTGRVNNYQLTDNNLNNDEVFYYRLMIHSESGATEYSKIISVKREQIKMQVSLFPNPTSGLVNIRIKENTEPVSVLVMDHLGKVIMSIDHASPEMQVDMSQFARGVYLIRFVTEKEIRTERIILN